MDTLRNLYCWMVAKLSCEKGQTVIEYVLIIAAASLIFLLAFSGPEIPDEISAKAGEIVGVINAP